MIGIGEYCYDELLMGGSDRIGPKLFFAAARNRENEKTALELIRYGLEYYLGWDGNDASELFSEETLLRLGILGEVKDRIAFPPEAADIPAARRKYLLSRLYPDSIDYDPEPYVAVCYEKSLASGRLPEGFFEGDAKGCERARICLLTALRKDGLETAQQMFRLMGSGSAGRWLRDKRLKRFCDCHFPTPADFLRDALRKAEETEPHYLEAVERIRKRKEGARRRYGTLSFSEDKMRDE